EVLHDEVHAAVGGGTRVGDVDDVRVADLRGRARFATEPLDELRHARVARMQDLERDALADLDVLGEVDLAHAAFTDELGDAIAALDLRADAQLRRLFLELRRQGGRGLHAGRIVRVLGDLALLVAGQTAIVLA